MSKDSMTINVIPISDKTALKNIRKDIEEQIKNIRADIGAKVNLDKQEAEEKLSSLITQKNELDKVIDINIDTKNSSREIQGIENSLKNFKNHSGVVRTIGQSFSLLNTNSRTLNTSLRLVSGSVNGISNVMKSNIKEVNAFSVAFKKSMQGENVKGLLSSIKQIPTALSAGKLAATGFGVALKGALISSGIGALVVGVGLLIEKFVEMRNASEEAKKSEIEKSEEMIKSMLEREKIAGEYSEATKKYMKIYNESLQSGEKFDKNRAKNLEALINKTENLLRIEENKLETLKASGKYSKEELERAELLVNKKSKELDVLNKIKKVAVEKDEDVKKTKITYTDFNSELEKLQRNIKDLEHANIVLGFDDSIFGNMEKLLYNTSNNLRKLEEANADNIANIKKMVFKGQKDREGLTEEHHRLLAEEQKRYNLAVEGEEKTHQINMAKLTSRVVDPDIFRKNNLEVLKQLREYYNERKAIAGKNAEEVSRLEAEFNQRALIITQKHRREAIEGMKDYLKTVKDSTREFQKVEGSAVFVKVAEDLKKSLGIMRDSVRAADLNKLLEQHWNIEDLKHRLDGANNEVRGFAEQYKNTIDKLASVNLAELDEKDMAAYKEKISKTFGDIDAIIEDTLKIDFSKLTPENEAEAIATMKSSLENIIANAEKDLGIKIDIGDLSTAGIQDLVKSLSLVQKEIGKSEKSLESFRNHVNKEGQFSGYARQITEIIAMQSSAFPSPKSNKNLIDDYEKRRRELKIQFNNDIISYEDYYDQLEELNRNHQEELANIEAEYRAEKFRYFSESVTNISEIFSNRTKELLDEVDGDLSKLEDKTELTAGLIATGLGSAFAGIFDELAEGELTFAGFFRSILKGALSTLPALLAMKAAIDPSALLGITAGVSAVMIALKGMHEGGQVLKFAKGGMIPGSYSGKDRVPIMAEEGEFIVPRDIAKKHLPSLERLRYTGQWNAPGIGSNKAIEYKLGVLIDTIKNTERQVKLLGEVKVNNKYFDKVKWNDVRMAY